MPNRDMEVPSSQDVYDDDARKALSEPLAHNTSLHVSSGCWHCVGKCQQYRIWNHKTPALSFKLVNYYMELG